MHGNNHKKLKTIQKSKGSPYIRQMAIMGNVCVGKTSLFDSLCSHSEHSVNLPGTTMSTKRGVLARGPGGASRSMQGHCSSCGKGRLSGRRGAACSKTEMTGESFVKACPALKGRELLFSDPSYVPVITHLYDTPGSATIAANSEDEFIARDLLLEGRLDGVVFVADAKNLRRSLAFALEVAQFGLPMVMSLNMLDESENMGIEVDDAALSREFGVPVGRTVAIERRGVRKLAEMILQPQVSHKRVQFQDMVEQALLKLEAILENPTVAPRALGLLLLSGDQQAASFIEANLGARILEKARAVTEQAQNASNTPLKMSITDAYYEEAERLVARVVTVSTTSPGPLVRFGRLAQQPLAGSIIGIGVLILAYYWIGAFGATFVVDNLATHVFDGFLTPLFADLVAPIPSEFVRDAIMDPDFGLLPTGLFLALGLVLPVLFCFYLLQSVLEDSGYLPRLAVLFDRLFRWLGLNGHSFIPLVLGFSCITMAVITTRMLPTRKERIILTFLLIMGIPCAPLLAVMFVILNEMSWTATATLFGIIGSQILLAGYIASKIIPGKLPDLIMEIPQMRIPRPAIVLRKTWRRTSEFMREAVPIFLAASFVVFLIDRVGGMDILAETARPFINGVLGLPDEYVQVFIKTIIRRENGATELNHLRDKFDNVQLVVAMLVMTFLVPCINAVIVIIKERGLKVSMAIFAGVAFWAVATGGLLNLVCRAFGVTFT